MIVTHGACGKSWGGPSRCHCSACHETFGGLDLFDTHRFYGYCTHPADVVYRGHGLRAVDGVWCGPERSPETIPTT